jgi:hypothetical protein
MKRSGVRPLFANSFGVRIPVRSAQLPRASCVATEAVFAPNGGAPLSAGANPHVLAVLASLGVALGRAEASTYRILCSVLRGFGRVFVKNRSTYWFAFVCGKSAGQ